MNRTLSKISLYAQAALYVVAGINHFWHTRLYVAIMPPHYSRPELLVQISGAAEIAGGLGLLVPATRRPAAWGIITMLLVYFDVHVYMLQHADRFSSIPRWALVGRLPLQFVLIAWAWMYARPQRESRTPGVSVHSLPGRQRSM